MNRKSELREWERKDIEERWQNVIDSRFRSFFNRVENVGISFDDGLKRAIYESMTSAFNDMKKKEKSVMVFDDITSEIKMEYKHMYTKPPPMRLRTKITLAIIMSSYAVGGIYFLHLVGVIP